eukprot:14589459-Ditylum_brightwellii.AAC.1
MSALVERWHPYCESFLQEEGIGVVVVLMGAPWVARWVMRGAAGYKQAGRICSSCRSWTQ